MTKVHLEAVKFAKQGYTIILIGHRDHDEVIGTLGEAPEFVSTRRDCRRCGAVTSAGSRENLLSDTDDTEP